MARTSRVRNIGGARRRRRTSAGRTSLGSANQKVGRARGERIRRRTRRIRGRARLVCLEEGKEGVITAATGAARRPGFLTGGKATQAMVRGGGFAGLRRRVEGKNGEREKRNRRTSGDYRRRLSRGRLGALVRREFNDRRERYLGMERRSLSTYAMVGYRRGSAYATEAGRKYFRVGARGSSFLVRGLIRVYGETGTLQREERALYTRGGPSELGRTGEVGIRRIVWVIRFKRGSRPVHRWVADIYEGAPTMAGRYRRIVPKRSRRIVMVRRLESASYGELSPLSSAEASFGRNPREIRMVVSGRGSVRRGGLGLLVQRRWKRYMAYSGIGNVGNIRRGGRRRTEEGRKGRRRTIRTYMRMVRRRWGGRIRRGVFRVNHGKEPYGEAETRERKYVTERRGRGKENATLAMTRTRGRMSRAGRPPRLGFGAKRSVFRAMVEAGRVRGEARYRERGGLGLLRGMLSAYGYLRRVKRIRMEEERTLREGGRRKRTVKKEGGRRLGRGRRVLVGGWRNGEGVEIRRERIGREVRKAVR